MSASNLMQGTMETLKSAWLITWEWDGEHAKMPNNEKIVAILHWNCSIDTVEKFLRHTYMGKMYAPFEQLRFIVHKRETPVRPQHAHITILENAKDRSSVLKRERYAGSTMLGENPYLWARIVYNVRAFLDQSGYEYLQWTEATNITWTADGLIYDPCERTWTSRNS